MPSFDTSKLCGWAGPRQANAAWRRLAASFSPFQIVGAGRVSSRNTLRLWDFTRKVLGRDTENYRQLTGDCVAFGAKNAVEYVECVEIAQGDRESFEPIFPSYFYGTSRILVGGGRLRGKGGSLGSWMAKAVVEHGCLRSDFPGVPKYSKSIAQPWGDDQRHFEQFLEEGRLHPIKSAARITSWEALVAAVTNGYPCTIASNAGYNSELDRDGFNRRGPTWPHQMCVTAISDDSTKPWAGLLNSWGEKAHAPITDFETGDPWPKGMLRITKRDMSSMIASGECFAYSQFDGFMAQEFDSSIFGGR